MKTTVSSVEMGENWSCVIKRTVPKHTTSYALTWLNHLLVRTIIWLPIHLFFPAAKQGLNWNAAFIYIKCSIFAFAIPFIFRNTSGSSVPKWELMDRGIVILFNVLLVAPLSWIKFPPLILIEIWTTSWCPKVTKRKSNGRWNHWHRKRDV